MATSIPSGPRAPIWLNKVSLEPTLGKHALQWILGWRYVSTFREFGARTPTPVPYIPPMHPNRFHMRVRGTEPEHMEVKFHNILDFGLGERPIPFYFIMFEHILPSPKSKCPEVELWVPQSNGTFCVPVPGVSGSSPLSLLHRSNGYKFVLGELSKKTKTCKDFPPVLALSRAKMFDGTAPVD
ncbi:uncharacterized protein EI90DRAFT_3018329 [Cantharellus anzutake]|uniref:uncharacterized protein n=1 Tax=Cantharellus anzutake TaxID=1750568 RepID=UPI001904D8AC|nr:uncharacterized protein EI90DRAFT_3018329 [Cantharellus anzutake]KAF8327280.1 hypothetical protein EI90DRAFT_3018329 [Cantharellus anzutake]